MPVDLLIRRGEPWRMTFRFEQEGAVRLVPITAIGKTAPATLTAPVHGLTEGWRFAVLDAKGITALNASHCPPAEGDRLENCGDFFTAQVVDGNTLSLPINGQAWAGTYAGQGALWYREPMDLTGLAAKAQFRARPANAAEVLLECSALNGRLAVNLDSRAVELTLTGDETEALSFRRACFDLMLIDAEGRAEKMTPTISVTVEDGATNAG